MERLWGTRSRVSCNRRWHRLSCVFTGVALLAIALRARTLSRVPTSIVLIPGCGVRQSCGVRQVKTFVSRLRRLLIAMLAIWVSSHLFPAYHVHGSRSEQGLVPTTRNLRSIGLIGV